MTESDKAQFCNSLSDGSTVKGGINENNGGFVD
jgi:hypothetical protein